MTASKIPDPHAFTSDAPYFRALDKYAQEVPAERDRYLCALDRIATPGYCPDPQAEAAMVLGRIPKD